LDVPGGHWRHPRAGRRDTQHRTAPVRRPRARRPRADVGRRPRVHGSPVRGHWPLARPVWPRRDGTRRARQAPRQHHVAQATRQPV
ncbi:hypothetical protein IWQ57_001354, partial [Coemansia nantahalensis]